MKNKKEINQTQVLNLEEVKEKSQEEKKAKTSKMFPIFLVVIGVILVGSGVFLTIGLDSGNNEIDGVVDDDIVEQEKNNGTVDTMVCEISETTEGGLVNTINEQLEFSGTLLVKQTTVATTSALEVTEDTTAALTQAYAIYNLLNESLSQVAGYIGSAVLEDTSLTYTMTLDYTVFDPSTLDETMTFTPEINKNQTKEEIKTFLQAKGYVCE